MNDIYKYKINNKIYKSICLFFRLKKTFTKYYLILFKHLIFIHPFFVTCLSSDIYFKDN